MFGKEEEKEFVCECGKTFTNPQSFNGHKSHCKVHHLEKYGNLDVLNEHIYTTACKAGETNRKKSKEQKQKKLEQWISEQHTCEKCGKVMTEFYGSGRFCSKQCANSRPCSDQKRQKVVKTFETKYYLSPKYCSICGELIPFERHRKSKICSNCNNQILRRKISVESNQKRKQSTVRSWEEKYNDNPKYCLVCGKKLPYECRMLKACSPECRHIRYQLAGIKAAQSQSERRRSKNEILFCSLCEEYFGKNNVLHNEPMFDGWDADVILQNKKIAILWNGEWHYRQISKRQSLEQVQSRDRIKVEVIKKNGYIPYIIEDHGKHSEVFVKKKFDEFLIFLDSITDHPV